MAVETKIDEKELEVANMEAENSPYLYVHKFAKPFSYEGKTYNTLTFDWAKLTGNDGMAIEDEMQAIGKPVVIPSLSGGYLIRMACRACTERIGYDVICAMGIQDYNKIRSAARSFLLKSEL